MTVKEGVQIAKDAANTTYTLSIPKLAATHNGTVTVKATNVVGSVSHEFNVMILG